DYRDLPLVNGENIESGTCRLIFRRSAADERAISPKYLFKPGDILYSKLRPYLRKVVVADEIGLCSADMYPLAVDSNVVDANWLAWTLVGPRFTRFATEASARARMPKLNREQLFAFEIAIPSIKEQRRVVAALHAELATVDMMAEACGVDGVANEVPDFDVHEANKGARRSPRPAISNRA
ncbi:MAG TPA: restriction endonuclease subunit S, partial [Candidatus Limnocylindrales bacterium]